jgi:hypothetical protein
MQSPLKLTLALIIALALSAPAIAAKGGSGNGNANGHDKSDNSSSNSGNGNGNNGGGNGNGNGNNAGGNGNGANNGNGNGNQVVDPTTSDAIVVVPDDQQVVQNAVRARAALSLDEITAVVGGDTNGRILDVQLVTFKGIYLYDVTVLEQNGVLHKLYYNARSGIRVRTD